MRDGNPRLPYDGYYNKLNYGKGCETDSTTLNHIMPNFYF